MSIYEFHLCGIQMSYINENPHPSLSLSLSHFKIKISPYLRNILKCLIKSLNIVVLKINMVCDPNNVELQDFDTSIEFFWAPLLVELKKGPENKRILHLDLIEENAKNWRGVDILVFDSAHWWTHSDQTSS